MLMNFASRDLVFYPRSLQVYEGVEFGLARSPKGKYLVILAPRKSPMPQSFSGDSSDQGKQTLLLCPANSQNAAALRSQLSYLQPRLLGLQTSAGMGDRMGIATPGHVRAVSASQGSIAPIFAQQSIREMNRTQRTPQNVMDDATWGIFQEGWQAGVGADADHLKTTEDIDTCLAAGFTFFTIDPGAFVDNRTETTGIGELRELAEQLPGDVRPSATRLLNHKFDLDGNVLLLTENDLIKAAVKYGRAIEHVSEMYRHLVKVAGEKLFELEVSVDETEQPTTHTEHIYIATCLKQLGVHWVSLAPRYVGHFEKGVDYIGDLSEFEKDIAGHAAIARLLGPYKLSLHSGSDKFSIYPAAMRQSKGLVHLKTAGTSYLEALFTTAQLDPELLREIYIFARKRYDIDIASYHVSAKLENAPTPDKIKDWPALLGQFDAREILHHTFGSVLTAQNPDGDFIFKDRLFKLILANEEAYYINLEKHFKQHLIHFASETPSVTRRD
jgi:hypothetical protein